MSVPTSYWIRVPYANVDLSGDPTINLGGGSTITLGGIPQPFEIGGIPDPIQLKLLGPIPDIPKITTESKLGITELPTIKLDLPTIKLSLEKLPPLPATRIHLPANYNLAFQLFGFEIFSFRFCGEGQVINEPYERNPCEEL